VERLLQGFEDRRAGLPEPLSEAATADYFARALEAELPRLREQARLSGEALAGPAREALAGELERLVRQVVVPGYVRLAARFTARERNDFFRLREGLHGLERVLWAAGGILLGAFVVWAPFVPLWSKEWVLPFALGGLLYPELRRLGAARRYEREVNALVLAADREASRLALAHVLSLPADADADPLGDAAADPLGDAGSPARPEPLPPAARRGALPTRR
jgi:hypothetical protein